MRRFYHLLVLGTLSMSLATAAHASTRINPATHAGALNIDLGNKMSLYHKSTPSQPLVFRISGPVMVRVLSRYMFQSGVAEPTIYEIVLTIDDIELTTLTEKANISREATYDGDPVGTLERTTVSLPAGEHTVYVRPKGEDEAIALRLFKGDGKKPKLKWVSFAPNVYEKAVRLHGRDSEVTYYRLTRNHNVELTLKGPMRLRVMSRVDFGTENGHTQAYVIKVLLDGEEWKSRLLKSQASHTSTYPDMPEITPGMGEDFRLNVPKGEHKVTLVLDCTTAEAASVRILVAEKDLLAASP
jgi:hypothetical protein